ncbi:hypothetical protein BN946_scf185002.g48 [Trametes cinnabarina]|uniref:Dol-P-Man:Man(5)GlcNAc(2)-PP-Dol alpha-1,3-mannosyltransferase n=1 Tax=Pycnoporus cinnabarinus TaxID=5643 RepID=A0A060SKC6_PYCCI|nr:hypothetical protein BN946_scf185002.g48 [Trametes cinnabarina]
MSIDSALPRPILSLWRFAFNLLTDPQHFAILAALVVLDTEIDWETYMYQLELYLKGERDYALISGPTGPIVYVASACCPCSPLNQVLYNLTDAGTNLWKAQEIYAVLYLASLALTAAVYRVAGNIPNWTLLLLPLSKRIHSIYVLRLFNDCWAVVAAQAAVLAFANGWDAAGILLLGGALSVKMCVLLYVPGLLVVLFKRRGLVSTILHVLALGATQLLIGLPFLAAYPWSYLKNSYEFSRVFLFKWTVNWRFLGEELFLNPLWAKGLSHGGVWGILIRGLRKPTEAPTVATLTADYVTTVLYTSNLIGILFARSLHYQFYSWYAMQLPFLAWRTKYPIPIRLALLLAIEYAWNVYPSTSLSSGMLVAANAALVLGIWFGYPEGVAPTRLSISKVD